LSASAIKGTQYFYAPGAVHVAFYESSACPARHPCQPAVPDLPDPSFTNFWLPISLNPAVSRAVVMPLPAIGYRAADAKFPGVCPLRLYLHVYMCRSPI
jgi:hypothetical protein